MHADVYRHILEASNDAIIVSHAHSGVVEWVNRAAEELYGYSQDDFTGLMIDDLCGPAAGDSASAGVPFWQTHIKQDRSTFPVDVSVSHVDADDRKLMLMIVRDVTDRQQADELRRNLWSKVVSAQEKERRRVARELHDETGPWITSLIVRLKALEDIANSDGVTTLASAKPEIEGLRKQAETALSEIRNVARGLHPHLLETLGLERALHQYATDFGSMNGMAVDLHLGGVSDNGLPVAIEVALYRIVQEALTNAARHGKAKHMSIVVHRDISELRAVIEDDGAGFEVNRPISNSLGLLSVRERAELLGGRAEIESEPGVGTTLYVHLPLGA